MRRTRRAFLRGAGGAMLAIPLLEYTTPAARAGGASSPLRFLSFYTPNGFNMASWTPSAGNGATLGEGSLSSMLDPLADVAGKFSVFTGLNNNPANGFTPGHAPGTGAFMTCHKVSVNGIDNTTSADLLFADSVAGQAPIHSLQLGTDDITSPNGDAGMSQAYEGRITWRGSDPLDKVTSPRTIFELLFSDFDPEATTAELEREHRRRTLVVDRVLADANALRGRLGAADKHKLDEYLSSVDSLQSRIDSVLDGGETGCAPGEVDSYPGGFGTAGGDGSAYETEMELLNELMFLAFACDRTRVISFMLNEAHSYREFAFIGAPGPHHEFTHNRYKTNEIDNDAARIAIESWMVKKFGDLLRKLDDYVEPDGRTLLENSLIHFGNENGDGHSKNNVPVLLAGGAGGALSLGKHHVHSSGRLSEYYLAVLQTLGVDVNSFGDDGSSPINLA